VPAGAWAGHYEIGKTRGVDNMRDWFKAPHRIVTGYR